MDEMNEIILCKHCCKPEYYGDMRWLNGKCMCRQCYKEAYRDLTGKLYKWSDLDEKPRPTMKEYLEQQENTDHD